MDIKEVAVRLILAAVFGAIIGIERQIKHHPAGIRTNTLVCIGAASIMILSQLINIRHFALYGVASDPARMGAQVISGIGFLGAGTILHSQSNIKGLTTAASLWAVACIGLVVGSGFYMVAFLTTVLVFVVLFVLNAVTKNVGKVSPMRRITLTAQPDAVSVSNILYQLHLLGIDMKNVEAFVPMTNDSFQDTAEISFIPEDYEQLQKIIKEMQGIEGVVHLEM